MNEFELQHFRDLADAMAGPEPRNWQWIGAHMSQRMFGITEKRAKDYASRFGGEARQMIEVIAERRGKVIDRALVPSPGDVAGFIAATAGREEGLQLVANGKRLFHADDVFGPAPRKKEDQ